MWRLVLPSSDAMQPARDPELDLPVNLRENLLACRCVFGAHRFDLPDDLVTHTGDFDAHRSDFPDDLFPHASDFLARRTDLLNDVIAQADGLQALNVDLVNDLVTDVQQLGVIAAHLFDDVVADLHCFDALVQESLAFGDGVIEVRDERSETRVVVRPLEGNR